MRFAQKPFEDSIISSEEGDPTMHPGESTPVEATRAQPQKKQTVILILNILCVKDLPLVDSVRDEWRLTPFWGTLVSCLFASSVSVSTFPCLFGIGVVMSGVLHI